MTKSLDEDDLQFVILHGGAGNQLFQWAYAHYLNSLGRNVRCLFVKKKYSIKHANQCISNFLDSCNEIVFDELEIPNQKLLRVLHDPTHNKNPINLLPGKISKTLTSPFSYSSLSNTEDYLLGYFQESEMVHRLSEHLIVDLEESLFAKSHLSNLEIKLYGSQIIHVRQGDTMRFENRQRVGVLSKDYYSSLETNKNLPLIVLTDDINGAKKVVESLNVDGFYGPEELDVPATLRVMSRASSLYCANSTLAWWGGFLASKNGGDVYVPDPFFLNVNPDPGKAFRYPGFQTIKSQFMS